MGVPSFRLWLLSCDVSVFLWCLMRKQSLSAEGSDFASILLRYDVRFTHIMENLRHLRALQAFNETAAHSNLSKAADTLNVTHGAISRQLKQLEQYLGVALFHRRTSGVELTEAGLKLFQSTRPAFSSLQLAVQDLRTHQQKRPITVSLSTSLALKWFVPRMPLFRQQFPDLSLLLDTNDGLVDFDRSDVDVALRFGTPGWGSLHHEKIGAEDLVVVASPSLLSGTRLPLSPDAIAKLPLLYDAFNVGWEDWADSVGLDRTAVSTENTRFVDSAVLLEAALDGQGVALARSLLAADDIRSGRLVRLDESRISLDRGLYFVCRRGDQEKSPIKQFRSWLFDVAKS
ncbi:LysR substrate-binding domain-containing protein [Rhodovibrionaceae bacterium A322]